jgi:hypothetical protein
VLDFIQLLLERLEILLVVPRYVGNGVFAGEDTVIFMDGASVDAVDAE